MVLRDGKAFIPKIVLCIVIQKHNPETIQAKMKLFLIFSFLLSATVAMPKIFTNSRSTIARRGTGMTSSSIRNYLKEQRRRAAERTRIHNILHTYFQIRDSMH